MSESTPDVATQPGDELLLELADDYLRRCRAGEEPTLDEYASKHPELADRIRELFPAMMAMEQSGPGATVDSAPPTERVGAMIGRYKLLERIGEGGFGVVYMAEQQHPVRRKVALKVVKPGMDSRQVLARFEAERQALAIMDHPNIAKVFDAGATDSGRPYFVMELIKGEPITEFCDRNQFTPQQRLELFAQVCHAVQHAHQKGIIHRDIKPTNVLVGMHDTTPVVKVIDFGVAKALGQELTEKTLFTGFAQFLGTPLYMSPEQAGQSVLDVDTRSDIYALGVMLYELLTGTTPFDKERFKKAVHDEIFRIIREEEPPTPSSRLSDSKDSLPSIAAQRQMEPTRLTKLVRGELDWIVMKALEKDRTRRYETASGMARDIERYLHDEPVEACPPSSLYRIKKFVRRNKARLATAALIGVALLCVVGSVSWAARNRAVRQMKASRQVESILTNVDQLEREQKWPEALAAARRAEAVVTGDADAATAQRVRERLKDLEFVDRLEQVRILVATWRAGEFDNEGVDREYARAFRDYGVDIESLTVERSIQRLKDRPLIAIRVAAALDHWATERGNAKKDAVGSRRLLEIASGIDPEPLRDRLRSTWGKPSAEVREELSRLAESIDIRAHDPATLVRLAKMLERVKRADLALRLRRDAQVIYSDDFWTNFYLAHQLYEQSDHEGAARFFAAAVAIRPNVACVRLNLGNALHGQSKLEEAATAYRKAIEIEPSWAMAYSNLGNVLREQGKLDEAIAAYRKLIEIDPKSSRAYINLGADLRNQGKLDEAIAACRKAIELDPKFGYTYVSLGSMLREQGKLDEAIAMNHKAIEIFRKQIEIDPRNAVAYVTLAVALRTEGKLDEAIAAYRKAIEINPRNPDASRHLGSVLRNQGKLDEAIATYRKAIEIYPGDNNAYLHLVYSDLGRALKDQGKLDEAIAAYRKAIEIDPRVGDAYNGLAWLLATCSDLKFRDPGLALTHAKKATELPSANPNWFNTLGVAYYRNGDWRAAIAAHETSMALRKGGDSTDKFFMAMAHWQLGNKDEARRWYEKAVETMGKLATINENQNRFRAEAAELLGVDDKAERAALEATRQLNQRAWALATNADPTQRDPKQAVALAEKAVAELPKDPDCWNTLGVARYRAGDFEGAIAALQKFRELRTNDQEWSNPFFLAMAHWQLGKKDEAHQWYEQGIKWMDRPARKTEFLLRIQNEAAELLGLNAKKESKPSSTSTQ